MHLHRRNENQAVGASMSEGRTPPKPMRAGVRTARADELITGRLVGHGAANYQFRRDQDPSYYVKLQTDRGERVLWGKDLERAVKSSASGVSVGDIVGARRADREVVTVIERQRDAQGRVVSQSEQLAHRNRWIVEKVSFLTERARLARQLRDEQLETRAMVREHPELASTFLTLRSAELYAAKKIADPKDRERFVELVKGAITGSIRRGEPLPTVRMRDTRQGVRGNPSARRRARDESGPAR